MSLWVDIERFVFPRFCGLCQRKLMLDEECLCLHCLSDLLHERLEDISGNEEEQCVWEQLPVVRIGALFRYRKGGKVGRLLHLMKYRGRQKLCVEMGKLAGTELFALGFFEGIDYLVPVPLTPARLRQRGYNQSELLACGISRVTGVPLCTDAVYRQRNNVTQTHQSMFERWGNVKDAFALMNRADELCGKHILLIDDVLTTGATLTACADAFSSVEGIKISILTLARAR